MTLHGPLESESRAVTLTNYLLLTALLLLLSLPVVGCILWSLTTDRYLDFSQLARPSLASYGHVLSDATWRLALGTTIIIGFAVGVLSTAVSYHLAALLWVRPSVDRRGIAQALGALGASIPWSVYGVSLLYVLPRWATGIIWIILCQVAVLTLVLMGVWPSAWEHRHRTLLWAGASLGRDWSNVIWRVLARAQGGALVALGLLTMFFSLDDIFIVSGLGRGRVESLSTKLWMAARYDLSPDSAAAGCLFCAVSFVIAWRLSVYANWPRS
jgi:ABC-type spermidine/putrescine transport system permease subunit II